eukprot:scaffold106380_cov12-Tisochrysis_lutea.AAC.1
MSDKASHSIFSVMKFSASLDIFWEPRSSLYDTETYCFIIASAILSSRQFSCLLKQGRFYGVKAR